MMRESAHHRHCRELQHLKEKCISEQNPMSSYNNTQHDNGKLLLECKDGNRHYFSKLRIKAHKEETSNVISNSTTATQEANDVSNAACFGNYYHWYS